MSTQQPYQDGWVGSEGKQLTVVPRPRFPFANNPTPDTFSRAYERDWMVYPPLFVPLMARRTSWTSLVTYSEDFTNAAWTKVNGTAAAGVATAPDGNTTMGRLLETVTNAEHSVAQGATMTAVASEVSIFAAGGLTREWIKVSFTDSAATVFSAFFNVLRGYFVGASAGTTARIIPLGAGFFRCVLEFTPAAGAGTLKINLSTDGSTISYAGTTSAGVYLWGAQANAGTSAPYVSTTTATRTISAPDRDSSDPLAFLVGEEDPQSNGSEYELVRRLFSRVPLTQVVPSFIRINKPSPPSSLPATVGSYVIAQPDPAFQSYDAYARQSTDSDSGPGIVGGGAPTGGTFTLSFAGDTTGPIAYNATAGAVQSALNALSTVSARGGVTVTGTYVTGFSIIFATIGAFTPNLAGLTGGPFTDVSSWTQNGSGYFKVFQVNGSAVTGGTFTLTFGANTTAPIAWNATPGTVQAAINALASVTARGGVTTSPINSGSSIANPGVGIALLYQFNFQNPLFTVDMTNVLPSGSTATATRTDGTSAAAPSPGAWGKTHLITFASAMVTTRDTSTPTPHGITTSDYIYAKVGASYFLLSPGTFLVPSTTAIQFTPDSGEVTAAEGALSELGLRTRIGYVPGSVNVRCVRTSTFYLPGVTPGITTAADIVPPVYQGDAETMLGLIFAGGGAFNYDVGELETWRGPILSLTVTTILASDL